LKLNATPVLDIVLRRLLLELLPDLIERIFVLFLVPIGRSELDIRTRLRIAADRWPSAEE
jgi:hypothetical protein